jgi:hypothetical protein
MIALREAGGAQLGEHQMAEVEEFLEWLVGQSKAHAGVSDGGVG